MMIALTGTPGTGKTTVCGIISEQYGEKYHIIDLNKLVIDERLYTGRDEKRDSYIADIEKLEKRITQIISMLPESKDIIIEGHLSHFLPADAIIVLRAHPAVLTERLGRKNYPKEKIKENAEAEAIDVVLVESAEINDKVLEIDTTNMKPQAVVESIVSIIGSLKNGKILETYLPGKIDWIEYAA